MLSLLLKAKKVEKMYCIQPFGLIRLYCNEYLYLEAYSWLLASENVGISLTLSHSNTLTSTKKKEKNCRYFIVK